MVSQYISIRMYDTCGAGAGAWRGQDSEDVVPLGRPALGRLDVVLLRVPVEVGCVEGVPHPHLYGRLELAALQRDPVQVLEPRVALHVAGACAAAPEADVDVANQQLLDDVPRLRGEARRGAVPELQDVGVDLLVRRVLVAERRHARAHLVDEHPQRPPVDSLVVALAHDDLRGYVVGGAAHGVRAALHLLREAVVHHLDVALGVQQEVLGLEVAVHNVLLVHVLQHEQHARGVEPRVGLLEPPLGLHVEVLEELAAVGELQEHVDAQAVLEGGDEAGAEGVRETVHQEALVAHVLLLLVAHDEALAEALERVRLARGLVPH
mmetsp:Transcript_22723/g.77302  ORF Transcript_22723/g.77302 Transcript_22723/m.77302 type:complete len:322 (+) Transcript_22723:16-981(+)